MSDNEQAEAADDAETEAEDAGTEETAEEATAGLEDGDFVEIAYTIRTAEDGQVIDTTDEETAEDAEIDTEEYDFEPRTIAIGAGHIFETVEDELTGGEVGDEGVIDIPAVDAFGEYDPEEVETVAADKIPDDDRYPGAQVQIDQRQGRLETIIGGRARVDFNHPLAGEDLEYDYEILDVIEDREEKATGLLGMHLQAEPTVRVESEPVEEEDDEGDVEEVEQESLYIEATPQMQMNQQWMFQKQQVAQDLMDRLDLDRVVIEEVIEGGGMGEMGGMMGGMGGMGGGEADIEEALEEADVDAEELVEEIDEE